MPTGEELSELLKAVAVARDRQAFVVLFKHFAPRVKAYLLRSGVAPNVAEDLAQETMVAVWRKSAGFDPARAAPSTWIFTIARNLRIDHYRRTRDGALAGGPEFDADAGEAGAEPPLDEQLGASRRERRVRDALALLSDEQSQVLRLSFYEEQPHASIARALGLPLGTVKSRIRLAVARLRLLLGDSEP